MIVRAPRPEGNFYVLDKRISEDRRLSWGARGLLVYLLGKPDNWQVFPAALVDEVSESAKPTGRDGTYALLNELLAVGYIRREQARKEDGTLGATRYVVSESPLPEKPDTDPLPALPLPAEPYTAKPTQTKTDSKQGSKESKDLKRGTASRPDDVDEQVWVDFQTLRKAKKAPVTPTVVERIREEARKAGFTLEAALRICCARGWQGFNAEWIENERQRSPGAATSREAFGRPAIHPSFLNFGTQGDVIDA